MPDLSAEKISQLEDILSRFLSDKGELLEKSYIAAGGSAAVFKVSTPDWIRAFKVFDPSFMIGSAGNAEKKRLEIQRSLIGHKCENLVQIYHIHEFENTAISEMEFIEWPQLKKILAEVPDDKIHKLINHLIVAVKYLESREIVHRDIKPENIHISPDYETLKLLDLGVVRGNGNNESAGLTDQNDLRPFVATAQYSSPEYLFRLDEPSPKLWKGLNIYQVGAVLHDLIAKEQIFSHEMNLGNRWLVAKAVLTKTPVFKDSDHERLTRLKLIAKKSLSKDLDTRLSLVDWEDYVEVEENDPVSILKGHISKKTQNINNEAGLSARIIFERKQLFERVVEKIREELLDICGVGIPIYLGKKITQDNCQNVTYSFEFIEGVFLQFLLKFQWLEQLYSETANILVSAHIEVKDKESVEGALSLVDTISLGGIDDVSIKGLVGIVAAVLNEAIETTQTIPTVEQLHGKDFAIGG